MEEDRIDALARDTGTPFVSRLHDSPTINIPVGTSGKATSWERTARTIAKNWETATVLALIVTVIVALFAFKLRNRYESRARLEIDPPDEGLFSSRDGLGSRPSDFDYVETQVQILHSDELAIATLRTLDLDQDPEFVGAEAVRPIRFPSSEVVSGGIELTRAEGRALEYFRRHLRVTQALNSRLVEVSFSSTNSIVAAKVVNTLLDLFVDQNYRTRYKATMQASEWLRTQMSDLRQRVEDSNRKLVDYQRANGILSPDDKGDNTAVQSMTALNQRLVQAQADRIQLEAYVKMMESGDIDSLPQVRDDPIVQKLDEGLTETRAQMAEALVTYGKNHPRVKQLENAINELQTQDRAEQQTIVANLRTSYAAAARREQLLAQALKKTEGIVARLNEKRIQYNVLRNEAQANSDLYNVLLGRLNEAGVLAGLKASNIRVVDHARVLSQPSGPNRPSIIALGALMGVLGGLGLAFVREGFDNSVRTPDDLKALTGLPSLAVLPLGASSDNGLQTSGIAARVKWIAGYGTRSRLTATRRDPFLVLPNSPAAEGVRNLYASLMLSRPGHPPHSILVCSASPGEGKTTLAINLAAILSQRGKTCLVEGDLREPVIGDYLGLPPAKGLAHVLAGSAELDEVLVSVAAFNGLKVMGAGQIPPNPGDLVCSPQMRQVLEHLSSKFQFVVLDSAPLIPFSDARTMATMTDGVILVSRFGVTTRQSVVRSVELLTQVQARILGVVLNGVDLRSADFKYYYGARYGRPPTYARNASRLSGETRSSVHR